MRSEKGERRREKGRREKRGEGEKGEEGEGMGGEGRRGQDTPITTRGHGMGVHVRIGCPTEFNSGNRNPRDRIFLASINGNQIFDILGNEHSGESGGS
jgi:hypothetical protein